MYSDHWTPVQPIARLSQGCYKYSTFTLYTIIVRFCFLSIGIVWWSSLYSKIENRLPGFVGVDSIAPFITVGRQSEIKQDCSFPGRSYQQNLFAYKRIHCGLVGTCGNHTASASFLVWSFRRLSDFRTISSRYASFARHYLVVRINRESFYM